MTAASTNTDAFWTLAHGDLDDAARFETAALAARVRADRRSVP
jgi:hypothetical protein